MDLNTLQGMDNLVCKKLKKKRKKKEKNTETMTLALSGAKLSILSAKFSISLCEMIVVLFPSQLQVELIVEGKSML